MIFNAPLYEKIPDNPLDKVFEVHPCWTRDFTRASVWYYPAATGEAGI